MRQCQPEGLTHHLRRGRSSQKLTSSARRSTSPAPRLRRLFQRDDLVSKPSSDRLHFAGIFPALRHQGHAPGHQHAGQRQCSGERHHHGRQSLVARRDAHHARARRKRPDQASEDNRRVIAVRQRVEHARRPLRPPVAWIGASTRERDSAPPLHFPCSLRHQQSHFPVSGVISQRDRGSVLRPHPAVRAQDQDLFPAHPFGRPPHSRILGPAKQIARWLIQQHLGRKRQQTRRPRRMRSHFKNVRVPRFQNIKQVHNSEATMNAIYPGSFDPLTNGHLDVYNRASRLFEHVTVAILNNSQKHPLFSIDERIEMLREVIPDVTIKQFGGLLVDLEPSVIIRGIRNITDYEIEQQMAVLNRRLRPELDTVFLLASPENAAVSSRIVKEISGLGGDVSSFVPAPVAQRLKMKFATR